MSKSAMGIAITTVSTTALLPLGFIHVEPATAADTGADVGERAWIYVRMTAGDIANGEGVMRAAGATTYVVIQSDATAHPARVVGVAQHVIPQDSFGFVLRTGQGEVLSGGAGISADTAIEPAAAGGFTDVNATTDSASGISSETAAAAALATAVVDCRG